MAKKITLLTLFVLSQLISHGQFLDMLSSGWDTTNTCVGIVRDPGGALNYSSYNNGYLVIDPAGTENISLFFTQFNTESSVDILYVYDGVGTSGTLLGSFSGTSIPNGGIPVTSTQGALTLRFYSNCCTHYSGFQATYSAVSGTTPVANFIPASNTVAYNSSLQFYNTSLFGGSYLWDFGDGTTSTDENPSHQYTASGVFPVTLIASNCNASDTSSVVNITVGAAPSGTLTPDTLFLSTACGGLATGSGMISNGAGAGNLNYSLTMVDFSTPMVFQESFESGLGGFTNQNPSWYTATTPADATAPDGSNVLQFSGNGYLFDGMEASFAPSQPQSISYSIKNNQTWGGSTNGHVGFGPTGTSSYTDQMVYSYFSGNYLYIYHINSSGFYQTLTQLVTTGTWIDIEINNIDYTSNTYDFVVDGTTVITGGQFLNSAINDLAEINIFHYYTGDISVDNFLIGGTPLTAQTAFLPTSGTLSAGSSNNIAVSINTTGKPAGTYNLGFLITSNDTALDGTVYPIVLDIIGDPVINSASTCYDAGTLVTGQTLTDSILLYNSGCAPFPVTTVDFDSTDFSFPGAMQTIQPGDSVYIDVLFTPSFIGSYSDSVSFISATDTFSMCLTATVNGAPSLALDSSLLSASTITCGDIDTIARVLYNQGAGPLSYRLIPAAPPSLADVYSSFTANASTLTSHISNMYAFYDGITGTNISDGGGDMYDGGNYLSTNLGSYLSYTQGTITPSALLGSAGEYFTYKATGMFLFAADLDNVSSFLISGNLGADGSGTASSSTITATVSGQQFTGYIKRVYNAGDPSVLHLVITKTDAAINRTISTNTDSDLHSFTNMNGTNRVYYLLFSRSSGQNMTDAQIQPIMDDFLQSIYTMGSDDLVTMVPDSGAVSAADSVSLDFLFDSDGLSAGTYTGSALIETNQPGTPFITIPYSFVVSGQPEIGSPSACIALDSTLVGGTVLDSIWIVNTGCENLVVTSVTSSTTNGNMSPSAFTVDAFDSLMVEVSYTPSVFGTTHDTLNLISNLPGASVCLSAFAENAPDISVDTSTIAMTAVNCGDSVMQSFTVYNNGLGDLISDIGGTISSIKIVAITHGVDMSREYGYTISSIQAYTTLPVTVTNFNSTSAALLQAELSDAQVILVPEIESNTFAYGTLNTTIEQFVNSGGGLVVCATSYTNIINGWGVFTGASTFGSAGTVTTNSSYANHPILDGVSSSFSSPNATIPFQFSNPGREVLVYGSNASYEVVTAIRHGSGKAVYVGFDYYLYNSDSQKLIANAVNYAASKGSLPAWASISPDSAMTTAGGDSVTYNLWFHSAGLSTGTYTDTLIIESNDPETPDVRIPLNFTVNGIPELTPVPNTCLDFDTTFVGYPVMDSVLITNTGCDSLSVSGATSSTGMYSITPSSFGLMPEDSTWVTVTFSPTAAGNYADTLFFTSNDSSAYLCVTGEAKGAPIATVAPSSFSVTANGCGGAVWDTITVQNTGAGVMWYDAYESSSYLDSSRVDFTTTGASTTHSFPGISALTDTVDLSVVLRGDFDASFEYAWLYIEGALYSQIIDNNIWGYNDTIDFQLYGPSLATYLADGQLDITITNNTSVQYYSGYSNFHQVIVNASGGSSPWLTISTPSTGTLGLNSTIEIPVSFDPTGLADSLYTTTIFVETEDPLNPLVQIPVDFTVAKFPNFATNVSCISFGAVNGLFGAIDSIEVTNSGCVDLEISNITFTSGTFTSPINTVTIAPGGSQWIPVYFAPIASGSFNENIIFTTNIGVYNKCLTGVVAFKPIANYNYVINDACNGSVTFTDASSNAPVTWLWDFGDGNTSPASAPSHTYTKPGVYNVVLIASNATGSDTINKTVALPVLLYGEIDAPAQAMTGIDVQMYDSSQVANSWQWYFGDGGTDSVQNPTHKYTSQGTYIITLIVSNGTCTQTINKTIQVGDNISVDVFESKGFAVFPNPTSSVVNLESNVSERYEYQIFSAQGKRVDKGSFTGKHQIQVQDWIPGLYTIRVSDPEQNTKTFRLIIE